MRSGNRRLPKIFQHFQFFLFLRPFPKVSRNISKNVKKCRKLSDNRCFDNFSMSYKGRYVFSWGGEGGLGHQRGGSSVNINTKGGEPYPSFSAIQGEGQTPFPEFLMGIFVMLLSIFL